MLLDTSTFIRASIEGIGRLSSSTREVLENPETERCVSSISAAEIAIKSVIGKLEMRADEVATAAEYLRVTIIPYTLTHAQRLFSLPWFVDHRDPFDRMLIATALSEEVPIVTTDRHFERYGGLKVLR